MSVGLRALIAQAADESLALNISMYCGSLVISGRIIPPSEFYELTYHGLRKEVQDSLRSVRDDEERLIKFDDLIKPIEHSLSHARHAEKDVPVDEVTLAEVKIFPAIRKEGAKSGGHTLPVARIPFTSIDAWWIVGGRVIKGRGSFNFGFGFLLPIEI
jgi:hypothetical protein